MSDPRNSRAYLRAAARLRRTADPICARCGDEIDLTLHYLHPKAWTADHVTALAAGGHVLGPLVPMHRDCNASKGRGVSGRRTLPPHPSGEDRTSTATGVWPRQKPGSGGAGGTPQSA